MQNDRPNGSKPRWPEYATRPCHGRNKQGEMPPTGGLPSWRVKDENASWPGAEYSTGKEGGRVTTTRRHSCAYDTGRLLWLYSRQ